MRRGLMRTALHALVLVLAAGAPTPAVAQQRDPRELEAKKACLSNRADRGIELLAELYAETNDPTYLYNQARCFQQNGRAQDAVTRFREYLRKSPNIDSSERTQIQGYITELEAQLRSTSAVPTPTPTPTPTVTPTVTATPTATVIASSTGGGAPGGGSGGDGHTLRIAGIATAAVGAAALMGGIYMGLRAKQLSQEITDDASHGTFSRSKYDDGRRAETLQWVGYGVGAAALVGGGVLYMLGTGRSGGEAGSLTAMPAVAPGMTGGALRVVF